MQCRSAIAAMRANLDGPAQSHSSNIIDSIVLGLHGKNGREHAKTRAREDFDELPLQLAAENLSLRPLFRAFTVWFPNTGIDPPDHFAHHATSHAVGHAGVRADLRTRRGEARNITYGAVRPGCAEHGRNRVGLVAVMTRGPGR